MPALEVQRFRHAEPASLGRQCRQPDLILQGTVVRRQSDVPHPFQNGGRHQAEEWRVGSVFDLPEHAIEGETVERRSLDAVDPRAEPLHVGEHARGVRLTGGAVHEPRQVRVGRQIVLLPEAEIIAVTTIHQPVEISRPAEMALLDVHLESWIAEKRQAHLGRVLIIAIDRNADREIGMLLSRDRAERFLDVFLPLEDRHRDEDAAIGACGQRQGGR